MYLSAYEVGVQRIQFLMQGLVEAAVTRDDYDAALVAIAAWLRYSAARHLTWNRNYNVKPREIGAAQVSTSAIPLRPRLLHPLQTHPTAWVQLDSVLKPTVQK